MSFAHALSVRSDFSIGESLLQIDHIIEQAKTLGYDSVALVDTMSIHNIVDFCTKAKKAGLKPIVGCRLRVYDDPTYRKPPKASGVKEKSNQMVAIKVYLTGEKGLTSLMRLLTQANTKEYFYYHSRCGWADVLALEDVAISTGDFNGLFHHPNAQSILEQLTDRFTPNNVFVELTPINTPLFDTLNAKALAAAETMKLRRAGAVARTVVTYPTLYGNDADADSLDVLNAITTQTKMSVGHRPIQSVRDFGFKAPDHLLARVAEAHRRIMAWGGLPALPRDYAQLWRDGVKGVETLAGMCNYEFKKMPVSLPTMAPNEFMALGKKCVEGWNRRFSAPVLGHRPLAADLPIYQARLKYEMSVLKSMGFSGYFLLVEDLVSWAKKSGIIVGPGRGSCFLPGHQVICDKSGVTKAIEEISIGDKVLAHDGSTQEVLATLEFERDEEIIELEFSNGVRIECTKDHKFFTKNRGWVVAEELCGEDEFDDVSELARGAKSAPPPLA